MESKKPVLSRNFSRPDESRPFRGHGKLDILAFDESHQVGRGRFEPGWRWSQDVKPLAGTKSCEAEHFGYCLSGRMTVQMDNGERIQISAGEAFYLAPGHDAWVEGGEACELLDFAGYKDYAVQKGKDRAA